MQKQHIHSEKVPSSCVVGFLALFSGGLPCFLWGSICWILGKETGVVDLHVGHLGGGLGKWVFMLDTWEGGWDSGFHSIPFSNRGG